MMLRQFLLDRCAVCEAAFDECCWIQSCRIRLLVELICELQYYTIAVCILQGHYCTLFEMYEVELSVTRSVRVGGNRFK